MRRLETSARRSRPPAATNSRSAEAHQAHPDALSVDLPTLMAGSWRSAAGRSPAAATPATTRPTAADTPLNGRGRSCARLGPKWGPQPRHRLPPSLAGADSVESGESPLQRRHDFCGGHQPSDWSPTCATRASRYAQPIRARRCRAARRTCRSATRGLPQPDRGSRGARRRGSRAWRRPGRSSWCRSPRSAGSRERVGRASRRSSTRRRR